MTSVKAAVVWPRPRKSRWMLGRTAPADYPDLSDGLLFLDREGITVSIEESLGIPWNPLVRMHEFYSGLDPLRAARVALRARRYDAAICVGDATAYVLLHLRAALGFRLPILLIDPALSHDYPRRMQLQDYVLPRVEHVVVYGRAQLAYLAERYGTRVRATFLHHRADTTFYSPPPASASARVEPLIFSIGNDVSRDFETLAAAARRYAETGGQGRFVVQTTRAMADDAGMDIRREHAAYPQLRDLYRSADVVVIPLFDTIHAGGINSLLEAMATGCPLVVSGSRGVADYVRDGDTALVVRPGDADAMAVAIRTLVTQPVLAQRLGQAARAFATELCDNAVYARRLGSVLRQVVGEGALSPEP